MCHIKKCSRECFHIRFLDEMNKKIKIMCLYLRVTNKHSLFCEQIVTVCNDFKDLWINEF